MPDRFAPTCPFCAAPWSPAMLAELERYTVSASCACCGGGRHRASADAVEVPTGDLCCEACGKPIYRAPGTA